MDSSLKTRNQPTVASSLLTREVDMKKIMYVTFASMALLLVGVSTSFAYHGWHGGHHGRVGVWIGPGWGPGWGYPYYPYYYSAPPVVIQQQPDTYIQQTPESSTPSYWYYCREPEGYYPYVKKCPKGWLKVVPPSTPEYDEEE